MFSVDFRIGTNVVCISESQSHASGVQVNMDTVRPTEPDIMGIGLVCHEEDPEVPAFTRWLFNGTEIVNRGIITQQTSLCSIPRVSQLSYLFGYTYHIHKLHKNAQTSTLSMTVH